MSLATWKKKYVPQSAQAAARVDAQTAIEHALRKWRGLRRSNLAKHGVKPMIKMSSVGDSIRLSDGNDSSYPITGETCAPCIRFLKRGSLHPCTRCPLAIVRDDIPCDVRRWGETASPYQRFVEDHYAEPMIRWLTRARKYTEHKRASPQKGSRST